ncbi:Basic leucine zipper (bZIP) transcription factor atfB [Colletotrichum siamense]|nr:Basic leucine zipper (bZIP) transcription factor atfB [Colletotrichum siamense]
MASSDYPCPPDMVDSTAMFIPMPLYPTYPGQSGLLSPAEESQCQQWLGLGDHTVEPMYAENEPVDFTTKTTTAPKSRTPSSAAKQGYKRAKIGAGGKPSPSSPISYDDKATAIDDGSMDEGEEDEVGEQSESWHPGSRKKYRAKNREAAKRCREKTKQYEEDLAVKSREIEQQRMYLDECVTALQSEVLALKNQILQHGDCDCELINRYIARAAGAISAEATPTGSQEDHRSESKATPAMGSARVGWTTR